MKVTDGIKLGLGLGIAALVIALVVLGVVWGYDRIDTSCTYTVNFTTHVNKNMTAAQCNNVGGTYE